MKYKKPIPKDNHQLIDYCESVIKSNSKKNAIEHLYMLYNIMDEEYSQDLKDNGVNLVSLDLIILLADVRKKNSTKNSMSRDLDLIRKVLRSVERSNDSHIKYLEKAVGDKNSEVLLNIINKLESNQHEVLEKYSNYMISLMGEFKKQIYSVEDSKTNQIVNPIDGDNNTAGDTAYNKFESKLRIKDFEDGEEYEIHLGPEPQNPNFVREIAVTNKNDKNKG